MPKHALRGICGRGQEQGPSCNAGTVGARRASSMGNDAKGNDTSATAVTRIDGPSALSGVPLTARWRIGTPSLGVQTVPWMSCRSFSLPQKPIQHAITADAAFCGVKVRRFLPRFAKFQPLQNGFWIDFASNRFVDAAERSEIDIALPLRHHTNDIRNTSKEPRPDDGGSFRTPMPSGRPCPVWEQRLSQLCLFRVFLANFCPVLPVASLCRWSGNWVPSLLMCGYRSGLTA